MTGFFIVIGVLIALGLAFVLPALVKQCGEDDRTSRAQANVVIYRDQLNELDADLANGTISAEQHTVGRRELEKRALEDTLAAVNDITPMQFGRGRWAPVALAVLIPVVLSLARSTKTSSFLHL
jgi:cytochrome c-type biogenesis protein CcmH